MFNTKKDREVINITIEFNLSAISLWLKKNGEIQDIETTEKFWGANIVKQSYFIDVIPNGKRSDSYFHRNKSTISSNIDGIDYFDNSNEGIKRFVKDNNIQSLSWAYWGEHICLYVNKKPIIFTPLFEFLQLQELGSLSNPNIGLANEKIKVKTPLESKNFIEIWRTCLSSRAVGYHNVLGTVHGATGFRIQYSSTIFECE